MTLVLECMEMLLEESLLVIYVLLKILILLRHHQGTWLLDVMLFIVVAQTWS